MEHSILFGNGLNLLNPNMPNWQDLLNNINAGIVNNKSLPYSMTYEYIYLSKIKKSCDKNIDYELDIKKKISEMLENVETNEIYQKLSKLPVKNYMTTNYDYAICSSFGSQNSTDNSEKIYSVRRHKKFDCGANLWFIHGEIEKPESIMLGLDHYCGSIGKIGSYLKGTYSYSNIKHIDKKIIENTFDSISWIELFFKSNVHLIGFGLDYAESDIWWILNKRARLIRCKEIKNKIYYYTTTEFPVQENEKEKHELLKMLNVEVLSIPLENKNYLNSYKKIIELMETCIAS